jgi:hypothetical protein
MKQCPTLNLSPLRILKSGSFDHKCIYVERRTAPQPIERTDILLVLAIDNIRHFWKKPKKVVREWVVEHFPEDTGDSFVLGIPMSVLDLIVLGIPFL